jgi:hypothetical protein
MGPFKWLNKESLFSFLYKHKWNKGFADDLIWDWIVSNTEGMDWDGRHDILTETSHLLYDWLDTYDEFLAKKWVTAKYGNVLGNDVLHLDLQSPLVKEAVEDTFAMYDGDEERSIQLFFHPALWEEVFKGSGLETMKQENRDDIIESVIESYGTYEYLKDYYYEICNY